MSDKDARNIEAFVRKNYSDIYHYLYHRLSSVEDAQDLTQETFLRYVQSVGAAQLSKKGRAYLFTIARNVSIDYYRAKRLNTIELSSNLEETLASHEPERDNFSEIVAGLSKIHQELLSLRYAQGFGINEIATITGLSRFSIRRKIAQALSSIESSWKG